MDKLAEGLDVILEIDPQGALQVKKSFPDGVFVFIVPLPWMNCPNGSTTGAPTLWT